MEPLQNPSFCSITVLEHKKQTVKFFSWDVRIMFFLYSLEAKWHGPPLLVYLSFFKKMGNKSFQFRRRCGDFVRGLILEKAMEYVWQNYRNSSHASARSTERSVVYGLPEIREF